MMKNFKFTTFFLFIFLVGCGFNSVLNDNSINFSIEDITQVGDKNINEKILINLNNYRNNPDKEKKYYLKINSVEIRSVTSKDTKGDPKTYRIEIKTNIEVSDINNKVSKKNFLEKKKLQYYV